MLAALLGLGLHQQGMNISLRALNNVF